MHTRFRRIFLGLLTSTALLLTSCEGEDVRPRPDSSDRGAATGAGSGDHGSHPHGGCGSGSNGGSGPAS
ncbi:hypothetical protein F0P96_04690 [Hymenobacter busanensis]|uniref:Uncharacterized protein n=1 Tax=Hymenobacter busanensis TaxID=2607656 RepID=A0A7L5A2R4_9BACT|nr:hypothetical protein [Hymenobacter busanensis]KAA9338150.1 hypothetical protein F0P96_04690 [Hymenobacter busanensis]QHJ09426.1 hypothetical protein GUY19_19920 [Hymenobacter busanensis]